MLMRTKENPDDITIAQELIINALFAESREVRGGGFHQSAASRTTEILSVLNRLEGIWTDLDQDGCADILSKYLCEVV